MTRFVDTFAFLAWLNARDQDHGRVKQYFETCTGRFLTTEWVLVELADAFASPTSRKVASRFLEEIRDDPLFEIVPSGSDTFQAGLDLYDARDDKEWSLTDCISFAVMTDRGINEALTADHHFQQAGFHAVFAKQ